MLPIIGQSLKLEGVMKRDRYKGLTKTCLKEDGEEGTEDFLGNHQTFIKRDEER